MTKGLSFVNQFAAFINGDNAEVKAAKAWRGAESALKVHIANMDGDSIKLEDDVETAQEALSLARINNGEAPVKRDDYIIGLVGKKKALIQAEKALKDHVDTLDFLKDEYATLKA